VGIEPRKSIVGKGRGDTDGEGKNTRLNEGKVRKTTRNRETLQLSTDHVLSKKTGGGGGGDKIGTILFLYNRERGVTQEAGDWFSGGKTNEVDSQRPLCPHKSLASRV